MDRSRIFVRLAVAVVQGGGCQITLAPVRAFASRFRFDEDHAMGRRADVDFGRRASLVREV
jgi:hypothetical protein